LPLTREGSAQVVRRLALVAVIAVLLLMSSALASWFSDAWAQAGPFGVRAACIAPETILTERNQQQIPADIQETLVITHPIRRLGTPEDVAEAALFLASDGASWISGIVLDVAGGSVLV
jgi:NAD(P)-dependent dehydrogenase (short-subunit alcohol dehydrogenase family)